MRTHDVLIVGGGPVGVMLAVALADRGLDAVVWEARVDDPAHSRALGVHPPSIDLFDRLGLADELLAGAVRIRKGIARSGTRTVGVVPFDRASSRWPFVAAVPQDRTEAVLRRGLAARRDDALRRGVRFVGLEQRDEDVVVRGVDDEGPVVVAARFVVGADGTRSAVRAALGVDTRARDLPDRYVMGDFADTTGHGPDAVIHLERTGVVESFPLPAGRRRFVVHAGSVHGSTASVTADDVARLVSDRTGSPVDPTTSTMTSAFGVRRRLAIRTVVGRVVLIGDAAHEISPIGGQGMNLGWLDGDALETVIAAAVKRRGGRLLEPTTFARFEGGRARAAVRAARQAEWNTALGRPAGGGTARARDLALGAVLRAPSRHVLASVYAMRWA
ncbi:FAD-dependent oxidoreductase [Frigoribacterium sp. R86507]|uniref:FAD-dependent oxidoreductase n=1 Tax=Frigoribacterium sp. R86507 TaxID=3093850 RepID=UPI0037C8DACF